MRIVLIGFKYPYIGFKEDMRKDLLLFSHKNLLKMIRNCLEGSSIVLKRELYE